ncbi:hypothetical protein BAUCODRAFT_34829 [Baudoinia panamericana UAMH 10762]|uniref:Ketoreductase (KR) domain-containing protein n=1 Tax=Baudoinia panamericana (strain UAMH 10762) TaxID=717646 RepID=M2NB39_BAUPA|nr:uncharacterized protein BAUCODRAFT_34829 [Baudoinia panamericana UAMH 10762]EMC96060.1 hypothetical protein BAUCODRAFT_34829 [Baudoinia panamericana UAMH 10762]
MSKGSHATLQPNTRCFLWVLQVVLLRLRTPGRVINIGSVKAPSHVGSREALTARAKLLATISTRDWAVRLTEERTTINASGCAGSGCVDVSVHSAGQSCKLLRLSYRWLR